MEYKKHFFKFVEALDKKMQAGYETYGDESFDLLAGDLVEEIQQELLDVCGWSLVLWGRLERMKKIVVKDRLEEEEDIDH